MIEARDFAALREVFREWAPADLAEVIVDLPEDEQVIIFRVLPHDLAADVFEYLDFDAQQTLLRAMAHEQVVAILNEMAPDDRTALLEELPSAAARQLIRSLTPEERRVATALLGYPEDSVGRLMTPDFIAVREDWTIQQVIDDIRMREFLLRPLTSPVRDLMEKTFITLNVTDSQRDALNIFRKYDRTVLPVIDSTGVLLGIVTVDDMLDVAEKEATEDIQKFGGMEALEEPYMRIPLWRMVRKRAGWLIILFLGEMLTATAMANYQEELAKALVLALFLPLIVSSGGNSGSQASTLMIRAMALGEVTLRDWWRVMGREIQAGLALGAILGAIGVLRVGAWAIIGEQYLHRQPYGPHWPLVAMTVGIALVGVVIWGTLSGSMLPFLLRRIGADPATSSAPFVATLVDVTGLIIYFSIALVIMRGVML